jgi:hypothetical protein
MCSWMVGVESQDDSNIRGVQRHRVLLPYNVRDESASCCKCVVTPATSFQFDNSAGKVLTCTELGYDDNFYSL